MLQDSFSEESEGFRRQLWQTETTLRFPVCILAIRSLMQTQQIEEQRDVLNAVMLTSRSHRTILLSQVKLSIKIAIALWIFNVGRWSHLYTSELFLNTYFVRKATI